MSHFNRKLVALTLALVATAGYLGAGTAEAQIVIYDPWTNQQTNIHASRLQPGANVAIPGSQQQFNQWVPGTGWVNGTRYLGVDGQWHGSTNFVDPNTGVQQQHIYGKSGGSSYRPNSYAPRTSGYGYRPR